MLLKRTPKLKANHRTSTLLQTGIGRKLGTTMTKSSLSNKGFAPQATVLHRNFLSVSEADVHTANKNR